MNCLYRLKISFDNAMLNNKKFIIIPYYIIYYNILLLLYKEKYIKNFIIVYSQITYKNYIFIELLYNNNILQKFKIFIFNKKLKYKLRINSTYKLLKKGGMFIVSTVMGLININKTNLIKLNGKILIYISNGYNL
uniref:Ribosomal protein S8 n=1 Tax=Hepatozoon canis TaxID=110120 RepID=A0A3S8TEK2_9APIC|nr:ribosomal protein S8 [Hepatozoon canis]